MSRTEIIEMTVSTILRPTGIDLAPYVINPYQGCAMGCGFCYAQTSKTSLKERRPWGSYVKVKMNAAKILERELERVRPQKVLLGSITECFQPVESDYGVTRSVLEVLVRENIRFVILSRSPRILDHLALLDNDLCAAVYFTVDVLPESLRRLIEPRAVALEQSLETIAALTDAKVPVVPYLCPILPWLFEGVGVFSRLSGMSRIEGELLNFTMAGMDRLMPCLSQAYPELTGNYARLMRDEAFYTETLAAQKQEIEALAASFSHAMKIHGHDFNGYFYNRYR
ncbi:MAG: radical SAM protein [Candidatus Omnitrophica bacterium]|nr:radical SAM protein [Candidatus Omnitrophota bacterium]